MFSKLRSMYPYIVWYVGLQHLKMLGFKSEILTTEVLPMYIIRVLNLQFGGNFDMLHEYIRI